MSVCHFNTVCTQFLRVWTLSRCIGRWEFGKIVTLDSRSGDARDQLALITVVVQQRADRTAHARPWWERCL
jgi:hypothetical protein